MTQRVRIEPAALRDVFDRMLAAYGERHWWPADGRIEILIGAVLTQNTAWTNVERALANLRELGWTDAHSILAASEAELAQAIRPSGYFNVKARRLRALCRWFVDAGGFAELDTWPTNPLRRALLDVHGIGRETADDIVLYAFRRPVFVVDAYTHRIFERLGWDDGRRDYEAVRTAVEACAPGDTAFFNELHALIVEHGKSVCRPHPCCDACPILGLCPTGRAAA